MEVIFFKCLIIIVFATIITLLVADAIIGVINKKHYNENCTIRKWQRFRLHQLVNNRIETIYKEGKTISQDEKDILLSLSENINKANNWNELDKIVNDKRIYSFINVAIMDSLYTSDIDTADSKNKFLQNLFIMDCVNGGVKFDGKNPVCFPYNTDIKETIQFIINNQEELTEIQKSTLSSPIAQAWKEYSPETYEKFKNEKLKNNFNELISTSAIEKTMTELINKKYVKDLSSPAKYVISKVILEIISNIIYSGNDYKKLSEDCKVYLRILAGVVANQPYDIIYKKLQENS